MPKKKSLDKELSKSTTNPSTERSEGVELKDIKSVSFPIIGLGASAGGLEALKSFFSKVPENSGMAYVVVIHMAPGQPSMLPDLLQKMTPLPVSSIKDGQLIEPGHIYVIPPGKEITVFKKTLQLLDVLKKGISHPIDIFFRSLAQDQGKQAAAIILSGTGTDGSLGIKEINANEGVVFAQSEESSGYDGMPRSAIGTGLVDVILPPDQMPEKLLQYFSHTKNIAPRKSATTTEKQQTWLNKVFVILRAQIGHDFSSYKVNTILRRIDRRMGLNQIDSHKVYVRYLRENHNEIEALFRELLIGVTNFFRDAESFYVLKTSVIPALFKQMKDDDTFRAWIPGCSTGEEVYSLAIVLRELLDNTPKRINLQLFGTDIDKFAVEKAREGVYPESITADVSEERVNRFFSKEGNFLRIRKEIRDCVVFSEQDLIKDPPFSRLNLLCCRNLMIYLDAPIQKKLIPLFHYTLKPDGVLMLGSSETIGGFTNLFAVLDKKWKIFSRQEVPTALRQLVDFPSGLPAADNGQETSKVSYAVEKFDITQITQKAILDQFAPTTILIDADGEILHIQGRTGRYLEAVSGPPTRNIFYLAREGLRIELSAALRAAKTSNEKITRKKISIKNYGDTQWIVLHVCPQSSPKELAGRFLVVFEDIKIASVDPDSNQGTKNEAMINDSRIEELERELQINRESHQTTIEELESSNEELKSTNEELQSSNEELQSTNEELESSKEELQSLNEELQTVNAELQSKLDELSDIQDDMKNLLNSTEIATIFVDNNLCIRRFTQMATTIVNFIPTDIGRPLQHVVTNLNYDGMITDLIEVLRKLIPKETEVQTSDGKWYKMRIMPYRTADNRIDGGVLTFSSIDEQKKSQEFYAVSSLKFEKALNLIRAIFDMSPEPTAVLDNKGIVIIGNMAFAEIMGLPQAQIEGLELFGPKTVIPEKIGLKSKLETALTQANDFKTEAFAIRTSNNQQKYKIQGRIISKETDTPYRILLTFLKKS